MSLESLIQGQKAFAIKSMLHQMLQGKYAELDDIISRISFYLVTDKDIALFVKLINDIFEVGYMRAVNDYKEQLGKMGIKVNVSQKSQAGSR